MQLFFGRTTISYDLRPSFRTVITSWSGEPFDSWVSSLLAECNNLWKYEQFSIKYTWNVRENESPMGYDCRRKKTLVFGCGEVSSLFHSLSTSPHKKTCVFSICNGNPWGIRYICNRWGKIKSESVIVCDMDGAHTSAEVSKRAAEKSRASEFCLVTHGGFGTSLPYVM